MAKIYIIPDSACGFRVRLLEIPTSRLLILASVIPTLLVSSTSFGNVSLSALRACLTSWSRVQSSSSSRWRSRYVRELWDLAPERTQGQQYEVTHYNSKYVMIVEYECWLCGVPSSAVPCQTWHKYSYHWCLQLGRGAGLIVITPSIS